MRKIFCYAYQYEAEEARCIYTCVNMLGVYLSATPHGSSRQAYLSGLACIINTWLIVSKKKNKKKDNMDLGTERYAKYKYL